MYEFLIGPVDFHQWHVHEGSYWWMRDGDVSNPAFRQYDFDALKDSTIKHRGKAIPGAQPGNFGFAAPKWWFEPGSRRFMQLELDIGQRPIKRVEKDVGPREMAERNFNYDIFPTGKDTCLAFVLVEKQMEVYEGTATWLPKKKEHEQKWSKVESYPAGFQEPFVAYRAGDTHFFVTRSGKLYVAPKGEAGKKRQVSPKEFDGRRPVVAVITDADAGKTFAFTRAADPGGKEERGAYLRLDRSSEPVRYDLKDINRAKAVEPFKTILDFTLILIDKKEVTLKP